MTIEKKETLGLFTDFLSTRELTYSTQAFNSLKEDSGCPIKFLNDMKILKAINVNGEQNPQPNDIKQIKASLFEVRFAYAILNVNMGFDYEHQTGVQNSSVDFRLKSDPVWYVELTSLRESHAIKENTTTHKGQFSYLSMSKQRENSPEVLELIKTQQAICHKVFDGKIHIKFPKPNGEFFNLIIVDMRSFNVGSVDPFDYINIVYGSKALRKFDNGVYMREWYFNGKSELIKGIFDEEHPAPNSKPIRDRIHAVGFIKEEQYEKDCFIKNLHVFPNLIMFPTEDGFKRIFPKELKLASIVNI